MDVKECPECNYQNLPVAFACKECGQDLATIEVTEIRNEDRLLTSVIIGGVSGIVGGYSEPQSQDHKMGKIR